MPELDVKNVGNANSESRQQQGSPTPTVSVIVPNYNHAAYLRERLDSILNQTFQDFELILLDDCSTDASLLMLRDYATHPRVSQLVVNEKNTGSTFAQ